MGMGRISGFCLGVLMGQKEFCTYGSVFGFRRKMPQVSFSASGRSQPFLSILPSWFKTSLVKPQCQISVCLIN